MHDHEKRRLQCAGNRDTRGRTECCDISSERGGCSSDSQSEAGDRRRHLQPHSRLTSVIICQTWRSADRERHQVLEVKMLCEARGTLSRDDAGNCEEVFEERADGPMTAGTYGMKCSNYDH